MEDHSKMFQKQGTFNFTNRTLLRALAMCAIALWVPLNLRAAELTTDQSDYAPGTTAVISGSGFASGEAVILQVLHGDGTRSDGEDHQPWTVEADASGSFTTEWHVCEDDCVDSTLLLTAVGQTSGLQTQTTFTDASFFGMRATSILGISGACTRTVTTPTNVQFFVRPGQTYRLNLTLNTNGFVPPCFITSNSAGPLTIAMSLGSNFGDITLLAQRSGSGNIYNAIFTIPPTACATTPITFSCDSGELRLVLGNTAPPDRPVLLVASSDCLNPLSCDATKQPPTITCPPSQSVNTEPGLCTATVTFAPTATGSPAPVVICNPPSGTSFPRGLTSVSCQASNANGTASCSFSILVRDLEKPILSCPADTVVSTTPGQCSRVVLYAVGASDNCPGSTIVHCFPPSGSTFFPGVTRITCTAMDASSTNTCSFALTVVDAEAPQITNCISSVSIPAGEGCLALVPDLASSLAVSDNCTAVDKLTIIQTPAAGTPVGTGSTNITVTVTDAANNTSQCTTVLNVVNSEPVIQNISGPSAPLQLGTTASVVVNFTDAESAQGHQVTFAWGDGLSDTINAAAGIGSATQSHTYAAAGVYRILVTVADPCTTVSKPYEFVVVYDPEGGFVTGGGWINSPAGAFQADPMLTGKASFGFVSKYHRGAVAPTGQTQFQFQAGDFNFHSTSYEWLVVAGTKAQFKGTGTINGAGSYYFLVTATDQAPSGANGTDKFRIKITGPAGVVYDNGNGAADDINNANPQAISGGSIIIHQE